MKEIKGMFRFAKFAFSVHPKAFITNIIYQILDKAEAVFMSVIFLRLSLNAISYGRKFSYFLTFFLISFIFMLLISIYRSWYEKCYSRAAEAQLNERLSQKVFEKANSVELACYENTEFYDNFTKAAFELNQRVQGIAQDISLILATVLQVVYLSYVILVLDRWAIVCILPALLVSFILGARLSRYNYDLVLQNTLYGRQKEYVERTAYDKKHAFEIRLLPVMNALINCYQKPPRNV